MLIYNIKELGGLWMVLSDVIGQALAPNERQKGAHAALSLAEIGAMII